MIGDLLEDACVVFVKDIVDEYNLYLDHKHPRDARGGQREVRWSDIDGNVHKLDIVLEEGGSEYEFGSPRAFIEIAWRRYTKHSKNKAQEIAGAILPLVDKYSSLAPFYGTVIAGVFTELSIKQLVSEGFNVIYLDYQSLRKVFSNNGIDIVWEEDTSDFELQEKVNQFEALSSEKRDKIIRDLINTNGEQFSEFANKLRKSLDRRVSRLLITPIFGSKSLFYSYEDALSFLESFDDSHVSGDFIRYEIRVEYTNGDYVDSSFNEKSTATMFVRSLSFSSLKKGETSLM